MLVLVGGLAVLLLPAQSVTRFAAMDGTRVPNPVTAVAERVKVLLSPELLMPQVIPVAVPFWVMSDMVNTLGLMGSENTAVKLIGTAVVGSDCVDAWLMVTVGEVESSNNTLLSVNVPAKLGFPAKSSTLPAGIVAIINPLLSDAIAEMVKVL